MMENHGESQCAASEGGMACMAHRAPPGFAWFWRRPLASLSKVYDMRFDPAPEVEAWQVTAVRVSRVVARPIHHSNLVIHPDFIVFFNRGMPGVTWDTGSAPITDGTLLSHQTFQHSHPQDITDAWLFQGRAEDVFMDVGLIMDARQQPWYGADAVERVRASIAARQALPNAAVKACSFFDDATQEETEIGTLYRHPTCNVKNPLIEWTMVVFVNPPADSPSITCPHSSRGTCSPTEREGKDYAVAIHNFLRFEFAAPPVTCQSKLTCTPGEPDCTHVWLGYGKPANCSSRPTDGVTECVYAMPTSQEELCDHRGRPTPPG